MSMNLDYKSRDEVIEAITKNINVDSLFLDITDFILGNFDTGSIVGEDEIIEYARKHFSVDEIFSRSDLEDWALSNGFVRES